MLLKDTTVFLLYIFISLPHFVSFCLLQEVSSLPTDHNQSRHGVFCLLHTSNLSLLYIFMISLKHKFFGLLFWRTEFFIWWFWCKIGQIILSNSDSLWICLNKCGWFLACTFLTTRVINWHYIYLPLSLSLICSPVVDSQVWCFCVLDFYCSTLVLERREIAVCDLSYIFFYFYCPLYLPCFWCLSCTLLIVLLALVVPVSCLNDGQKNERKDIQWMIRTEVRDKCVCLVVVNERSTCCKSASFLIYTSSTIRLLMAP